jgi:hypothetical protein
MIVAPAAMIAAATIAKPAKMTMRMTVSAAMANAGSF